MPSDDFMERLIAQKNGGSVQDTKKEESQLDNLMNEEIVNEDDSPDYASLIKEDFNNMSDEEFDDSRDAAFDSIKNDLINKNSNNHDKSIEESEENESTKTAAELYAEKHPIIKKKPKEVNAEKLDDAGSKLIDSLSELEKSSEEKSKILFEEQKKYEEAKIAEAQPMSDDGASLDGIDDILSSIDESNTKKQLEVENEEDLTEMIEKLESQKQFSSYKAPDEDEYAGPAEYIIDSNDEYNEVVEDVLESNNIRIIKKSDNEKNAILERFVNSGDIVTVPLVNSGIFISVSGASVDEIIEMNSITDNDPARVELSKLNIINEHIVGSSIGKTKLGQLIKIVSYHDIETLYYALYAATYPQNSEINRHCDRCGNEYFINTNTRDILINPEEFAKEASNIKDNVTTFDKLKNTSLLNKVVKKSFANGNIIVTIKHPNIETYINRMRVITNETMSKYQSTIVDMAYSIDKILVRDKGIDYIEFSDPNSIIEVLNKIKDVNIKYQILDMIEEIRPNAMPMYGYRETICPHCGNIDKLEAFSMEGLLFTQARQENEMATLRWAAKLQKKRQQTKK